jgi:Arc/MetJ-type ribon-helix-helix transcriptional regulator
MLRCDEMFYEKLILLTSSQREKLENIQRTVKDKGGYVSANQLIRDSLEMFLESNEENAIKKYTQNQILILESENYN